MANQHMLSNSQKHKANETGTVFIDQDELLKDEEQTALVLLKSAVDKDNQFPAMGSSISQIMRISNEQGCAQKLSDIILRDQSLSSKILRMVNSSNYGQFGGEINTISRAVVILGLDQIQSLSISIMVFDKLNNGPMTDILKSNACQSFLSAAFARKLVEKNTSIDSEEAFLASMFHNLGKQIAIYFLPDRYNEIQALLNNKEFNENTASKKVIGLNYADIGQYIAIQWQLPNNIIRGIQPNHKNILQKPVHAVDCLAHISWLTNEITEAAACGDNEATNHALAEIIQRYKASFSLDQEKVIQMLSALSEILIDYCEIQNINPVQNTFCKNFISFVNSQQETEEEASA